MSIEPLFQFQTIQISPYTTQTLYYVLTPNDHWKYVGPPSYMIYILHTHF